LGVCFGV